MTVLHTGSTKKFVAGWEAIFKKPGGKLTAAAKKSAASKPAKKGTKRAKKK